MEGKFVALSDSFEYRELESKESRKASWFFI